MNKKSIQNYKKGKRCKKVTLAPDFILKIKGKLDASKNESSAHVFINGLYDKCSAIEALEVSTAQELLKDYREEGEKLFYKVRDYLLFLHSTPMKTRESKQNAHIEFKASADRLIQIHKIITDVNTALERRITQIRKHCSHKKDAYSQGVKMVMPDFSLITYHCEKPIEDYLLMHKETDDAIAKIVKPLIDEDAVVPKI